mmetsp:Transcript_58805/g.182656  ORF Transcript_58805/g.182656 Transcript_58805/m.182656 type:complete len:395 (-) Transcript_58805:20-1204(-)
MEWYIESGAKFHPGRLATCVRIAMELCINERKARARQLCRMICSKGIKKGCLGRLQGWWQEARHAFQGRTFKAHEAAEEDSNRVGERLPRGAKAAMREAVLKVSGHTAVIEELQNALMLCERHIIVGKGNGQFYEIDKPSCDFTQPNVEEEEEDEENDQAEQKERFQANTLLGTQSGARHSYRHWDGASPHDVSVSVDQDDSFMRNAQEVGLSATALQARQAELKLEARELKAKARELEAKLAAVKEPKRQVAPPMEPPAQLGRGPGERHLSRSVAEDDLKEDLQALKPGGLGQADGRGGSKSNDMDDFLASLMDSTVGKYWRYTPVNGASVAIRSEPALQSAESGHVLKPGTSFRVSDEVLGDDGILYLKLADGRGWLFDQKPGIGIMCQRVE